MLKGQWFGPYAGTHSGNIIAEFDEIGGNLVGTVTAYLPRRPGPSGIHRGDGSDRPRDVRSGRAATTD